MTVQEKEKMVAEYIEKLSAELTAEITKIKGKPLSLCPECGMWLSRNQRYRGYSEDSADSKTTCPGCKVRFQPKLVISVPNKEKLIVDLFSERQTIFWLREWSLLPPEQILKRSPGVFYSCMYNFGSITSAYKKTKVQYKHIERPIWLDVVMPYLGKMSDIDIAKCTMSTPDMIGTIRARYGNIPKFNKSMLIKRLLANKV